MDKPIDSQEPLTVEEKTKIWDILHKKMKEGDRYPLEVVRTTYGGNFEKYLEAMRSVLEEASTSHRENLSHFIQDVPGPGRLTPEAYAIPKCGLGPQGKPHKEEKEE